MSFASPTRSSTSLDRFMRVASSGRKHGMSTYSETIYAKFPTKLKRLQSAHFDTTTGTWRCKNCGWDYPNPEPHHHQRREHKKICPGSLKVQRWLSHGSGPSTEGETDSHDTSNTVDKPTTPETTDTATAKLSLGQKSQSDGANRERNGDLAKAGETILLLERELKADGTPSRKELTGESEIHEAGDAKAGAHGEQILSERSGIVGSVEKLGDLDDLGNKQSFHASDSTLSHDPSQDTSDHVDLPAFTNSTFESGSKDSSSNNKEGRNVDMEDPFSLGSQTEADSLQGDQPTLLSPENRGTDQAADLGKGFEHWFEQRKSSQAADNEAEDFEDAEISSRADENSQKETPELLQGGDEDQLILIEDGNAQKQREEMGDGSYGTEAVLTAADNEAEDFEDAEMSSRADENSQKETPELLQGGDEDQLTLTEDGNAQKQREEMGDGSYGTEAVLTAADGVPREDVKDHVKHSYSNAVARDDMDYIGGDEHQSELSARDVGDEVLQNGRTPKPENAGGVLKSEQEAGNEIGSQLEGLDWESLLDKSVHKPLGDSLGSSTDQHSSPGQNSMKGDRPTPLADKNGVEGPAEDLGEGFEQREPRLTAAVDEGEVPKVSKDVEMSFRADQKQREEMGEGSGGADAMLTAADGVLRDQQEDVGTEEGVSTSDEDGKDQVKHSDPSSVAGDGMDYNVVGATPSKTGSAAEVISGKPNRKGVGTFSGAYRNWDGWEHVISGEDRFSENKMSPSLQGIEDAGQPFSVEGLTSDGQLDHLVNDIAPTLKKVGGVLKSDQDASNELRSQPEGLDWEGPSDKSVHKPLGDSLGSTSADHHSSPNKNWPELVPGLDQEVGGNVGQHQTDQTNKVPLKLSPAEANWDDWDEVIREVPMPIDGIASKKTQHPESSGESQTPGVEFLGGGDMSAPREEKTGTILESTAVEGVVDTAPGGLPVHIPDSERSDWLIDFGEPSVGSNAGGANEAIPALAIVTSKVDGHGANVIDGLLDHWLSPNAENGPFTQRDWGDLGDLRKSEYMPRESRHSSPSLEEAHDGELSSETESPDGHKTAVKLPQGKRRWADWKDLAKSEYMVLDGPGGESLVFKRASDARGSPLSSKSLREREPFSFEEPEDDGESPRLRSNRRQPPSFDDEKSPSFGPLKGASPSRVVTSEYSAGSLSFPGFDTTPRSLPGFSPSKSEAGDKPSMVSTRRPLLYRDSRRDYTSDVEDMDVTNEPTNPIVHHHDHNLHDHEDALQYDVEKVLRAQTQYELICPICGAIITRKIVIRKKKRRFISQGDPRWKRESEITPVEEDGSKSPRSDTSSEIEDARAGWKQGLN